MEKRRLGGADLSIAPVVFGGEVFGRTADARTAFDLLDRFRAAGLDAFAAVAARHGAKSAEVALAWLIAQPGVSAPIASATSPAQVDSLIRAATPALSADDLAELDSAAAPTP
jgi:aryl-alcohol dehydrogenase-like predicted oxidoreductase